GSVTTRAPARTASAAVPSPEPSSITTMSASAFARMSAMTCAIACRSWKAGTIARLRRRQESGGAPSLMAVASTPQPRLPSGSVGDGPAATVVIVNYRGRGRLGRCLDALAASPPACASEVVVVDNASDDGSWDEAEGRDG